MYHVGIIIRIEYKTKHDNRYFLRPKKACQILKNGE